MKNISDYKRETLVLLGIISGSAIAVLKHRAN